MKQSIARVLAAVAAATITSAVCVPAFARDSEYTLPMDEVLRMPAAQRELDGSVRFYLEGQHHEAVVFTHMEETVTGKIRGSGPEEVESCKRAALRALVAYQTKAKKMGANAVIDMVGFFKEKPFISQSQFQCHAGSRTVVVVFKGTFAKVAW
jgi:uncharacterized protein YbjQ (UPF0145 family)